MPATSAAKCSLAEALCSGRVGPKCELPWVLPGGTILDADGGVQKVSDRKPVTWHHSLSGCGISPYLARLLLC